MATHTDEEIMALTVNATKNCVPDPGRASPSVAAAALKDGKLLKVAFRSELGPGEHAEYTLLQRMLGDVDLTGSTIYTTLEPCTTRNHPKHPCVKWLIERKVREVVVGMLDPDPRIYGNGCEMLKQAGIIVRYFMPAYRTQLEEINADFRHQFVANPRSSGTVQFNYSSNNGMYLIGNRDYLFETLWTKSDGASICVYNDPPTIDCVAIAVNHTQIADVIDATIYDFTSRVRRPREGQIAIIRNKCGYYAAIKILDIKDDSRLPDSHDELKFEYRILTDKTHNFALPTSELNSDLGDGVNKK